MVEEEQEEKPKPKKKAAAKKSARGGSTSGRKKAASKKSAKSKKVSTPAPEPKPPTPTPRKRKNGGGGRALGFFLLIIIIMGAFIALERAVESNDERALKDKLASLEQKTAEILDKQGNLLKEKEELEEKVNKAGRELEMTQIKLLEKDIRARREAGGTVEAEDLCELDEEDENAEFKAHPKYAGLQILGEIFTAAECDDESFLLGLDGVEEDGTYSRAFTLSIFTDEDVTPAFVDALKAAGFACINGEEGSTCYDWTREGETTIDEMLGLFPYADQIRTDRAVAQPEAQY